MYHQEIDSYEKLVNVLNQSKQLKNCAFQGLDFTLPDIPLGDHIFIDCLFLACVLPKTLQESQLAQSLIFPALDVPFSTHPRCLYSRQDLFNQYQLGNPESYADCLDDIVYRHYLEKGKEASSIHETLARRLHDHAITDALYDFIAGYEEKKVVAIMGGHSLLRSDPSFKDVVKISKTLAEMDYLMVSGGGPGAMEATHVGAWLAGRDNKLIDEVIAILAQAPSYKDKSWLDKAFEVLKKFPEAEQKESLGIPTWLYGHEPPTPFASKIAKYFANSVREDGLLTIAKGGIVFSPGSAGTIQEIFQDATQNHYLSFGYSSPMVFLNTDYWTNERPVYPLLDSMSAKQQYQNLILSIYDEPDNVVEEILAFTKTDAHSFTKG